MNIRVILYVLAWCSVFLVSGQNIQFNRLSSDDGLTTGNVRAILEDYQGLFWLATEDGLMRYDGYEIIVYRHDEKDPASLCGNFILTIFEDSYQRIWVGTIDAGICVYDRETDSFRQFANDPEDPLSLGYNYVRAFHETADHKLYIGFENSNFSVLQLEEKLPLKARFKNLTIPFEFDKNRSNWGSAIIEDPDGKLLIGVNGGGIFKYDPTNDEFEPFLSDRLPRGGVQHLLLDSRERLWVGTWNKGVLVYDYRSDEIFNFNTDNSKLNLCDNQAEAIIEDNSGNIWIGTDKGLNLLTANQDPFKGPPLKVIRHSDRDPSSLLSNAVKHLFVDSDDRLWVSTYYGGANVYDERAYKFNPIRPNLFDHNGLSFKNVVAFAEDGNQNVWIGTDGGSINRVSGGEKNFWEPVYESFPELDQIGEKVKCLEIDQKGLLWIGTWGQGLIRFNPRNRQYKQWLSNETDRSISANEVLSIKTDSLNNLWIGTFSGGLNYYDQQTGLFKHYPNLVRSKSESTDKLNTLFIDSRGVVWAGPEAGGLCRYDGTSDNFTLVTGEFHGDDQTIWTMIEDAPGVYWIGTNKQGLVYFDSNTGLMRNYNTDNGLPNNVVKGITKDERGKIWLGTNKGLSVLEPATGNITSYGKANGLQGSEFTEGYRCTNGMMLFGGTNGMNAFFPSDITVETEAPAVLFTGFWLNNKEYGIRDEGTPLKSNILLAEDISLSYEQRSFSIGYAALEYTFGDRNNYAYQLVGFHKDWQYVGSERKATFTNLPPNKYLFQVKASNSDGYWGDKYALLSITVAPAWWQTIYFRVAVIVFILGGIMGFIKYRTYRLERNQLMLEKKVSKRTEEVRKLNLDLAGSNAKLLEQKSNLEKTVDELTQTKSRLAISEKMASLGVFTAGIAHEINNPINFISSATQKLFELIDKQKNDGLITSDHEIYDQLKNIMEVGVERTTKIIGSLSNYAKTGTDEFRSYNIVRCLEDSLLILGHKIHHSQIQVKKSHLDEMIIECIPGKISQIFINLLSNAIDAIDGIGEIDIKMKMSSDRVNIHIQDSGSGISRDGMQHIFDPFYTTKEAGKGTGLGLYIVYGIVEEHNGLIEVTSGSDGAGFDIYLPIRREDKIVSNTSL